jgi:hypothetical protein
MARRCCAHPNYPVFGAIVRENRKRCDALARQRAEISARADQQHNSVMQGNDRGIYGPQGAELIHCIYLAGVPTGPGRRGAHPPMAHGPLRNPIRELTTLRQATKQRFGRYSPANRLTADVSGAVCANRVGAGDGSPSPSIAYPGVIGLSAAPGTIWMPSKYPAICDPIPNPSSVGPKMRRAFSSRQIFHSSWEPMLKLAPGRTV